MEIDETLLNFRFHYRTVQFAEKAAQRLKRMFERMHGVDPITKGRALALVAQMAGFGSWEELKEGVDPNSVDEIDQGLNMRQLTDRRFVQAARLAKLAKIEDFNAFHIVDRTEPTGTCSGFIRVRGGETHFEMDELSNGSTNWSALENQLSKYTQHAPDTLCLSELKSALNLQNINY